MAIRNDFAPGEVLAAADLNDTFGSKANLASPTFTGTPAAPTAAAGTNTTQLATTAFVQAAGGLTLITSESFSAVSAVNINGCFTSTYQTYRVVASFTNSTNAVLGYRLRLSGSDATTNYSGLAVIAFTGGVIANDWDTNRVDFDATQAGTVLVSSDIARPNEAAPTSFVNTLMRASIVAGLHIGRHTASTSYDGLTLFAGAGTITGSIRIYGYRN
jgi:hypothetical protein